MNCCTNKEFFKVLMLVPIKLLLFKILKLNIESLLVYTFSRWCVSVKIQIRTSDTFLKMVKRVKWLWSVVYCAHPWFSGMHFVSWIKEYRLWCSPLIFSHEHCIMTKGKLFMVPICDFLTYIMMPCGTLSRTKFGATVWSNLSC